MRTNNVPVYVTVGLIWIAVIVSSVAAPDLIFGNEPHVVNVAGIANWFWGLLGSVFVLRSTVFRRPNESGYGEDDAWGWVAVVVGAIWAAAMLVSVVVPAVTVEDTIEVPAAAIVAPIVAAALTPYAAEFLIEGFAARNAVNR